jgi:hypothetical protein
MEHKSRFDGAAAGKRRGHWLTAFAAGMRDKRMQVDSNRKLESTIKEL